MNQPARPAFASPTAHRTSEFESPAPHDLLWIAGGGELVCREPLPEWATSQWLSIAPVVMRREATGDVSVIPVGLRGRTRSERHAAYLPASAVLHRVSPEAIAASEAWTRHEDWSRIPCIAALPALASKLDDWTTAREIRWGITGSAGFALATGIPVVREDSDLDLVLRSTRRVSREESAGLGALLRSFDVRVDVQVDTGNGGFALAEWAAGRLRVLLKTGRGPTLVSDPWETPADFAEGSVGNGSPVIAAESK